MTRFYWCTLTTTAPAEKPVLCSVFKFRHKRTGALRTDEMTTVNIDSIGYPLMEEVAR